MTAPLADANLRPALRARLLKRHAKEPDTVLFDELGVCRGVARIDLAAVNGLFHGFEIKSDRDTLRRLEGQVEVYNKVLDRATLVVGEHHLAAAMAMIPDWWGVWRIVESNNGPVFREVRRERANPGRDPRALVEMLWADQAIALLEARNLARGVRGKPRHIVWDRLCEQLALDEIAAAVRAHLKATAGQRGSPQ
jgi:hypothetical protein